MRKSRRRPLPIIASVILALIVAACVAVLLVVSTKPAEAAFPGKNGKIAFAGIRPRNTDTTNNWEIYTTHHRSF
jgi:hypothetical protein